MIDFLNYIEKGSVKETLDLCPYILFHEISISNPSEVKREGIRIEFGILRPKV